MQALDLPTEETTREAGEALRALSNLGGRPPTHVQVVAAGDGAASVTVPTEAFELLVQVLAHLANGHAVTVMPVKAELTTQQAADLLNVSRPHLIKLLDGGEIPYRRVGTHRRVPLEEVVAYRRVDDAKRQAAADALTVEAQVLDLGY